MRCKIGQALGTDRVIACKSGGAVDGVSYTRYR
jgi:hypothetical protein